jgi:hypothetical protein
VKGVAECRAKNPWRWAVSFSSTLRLSMVDLYDLYARRAPRIRRKRGPWCSVSASFSRSLVPLPEPRGDA